MNWVFAAKYFEVIVYKISTMANLILNKIFFKIINPLIPIWISTEYFIGAHKKLSTRFDGVLDISIIQENEYVYYSFEPTQSAAQYSINILEKKYFIKPYVTSKFRVYFESQEMMTIDDFINGLQVWQKKGTKQTFREYEKISLRQVSVSNISKLELLVSFDGRSYTTLQPLSAVSIRSGFSKYVENGQVKRHHAGEVVGAPETVYPVLGYSLKKELNFQFDNSPTKNTYLEYYQLISAFFTTYLQGKLIADNIQIYDDSFAKLSENEIHKTKFVSNKLRFGNEGEDNNVPSGLKRYGPYAVPDTENLRFIFIYKPRHSESAKKLHTSLSLGLKEGSFSPGLKDYLKVNFKMADQHRIVLESDDPYEELVGKLNEYPFQDSFKYFVIYLTDHTRFESDEDNDEEYYKVKYLLLQKGILSQFIYHANILGASFRYHLPNIQVAILAKLGGIPWKLDTFSTDKLIIGFGVKRTDNNVFLGNSLFFKEDGTFHKFESFQNNSLNSIGDALKANIETVLQQGELNVSKLVIHYYKTLNDEEGEEIERVLKFFNLNIPYVVLTINDSRSKDYLFFDTMYDKIMPVSGTIIELKYRSEYLLSNNMRHDETQFYNIRQFPFPLKIKINKSENVLHDVFDIKQLLDQVYSFSRIYWKSIGQASLPVTISYSKIVANLAAHFPDNKLPENPVAHSNLWFL
ncbi:Piwi domain-containing protein [Mucilaginibacter ximonensis]|uniref:Protein argonaute n=1 Tax=Mucilaginibacter ximonensis TaxID=538021 RepID=A0ABW5YAT8_9SPHI